MFLKLHFLPKAPSESPVPITTGAECRVSGVKRKRKEGSCFDTFHCRDFHWSRGGEEPCNQRDSPTLKTCTRGNDMNLSHFCEQYYRWRVLPVDSRWLLQQVEDSQLFTTKLNCTCSCSAVSGYISYSRLLHKKSSMRRSLWTRNTANKEYNCQGNFSTASTMNDLFTHGEKYSD